MSKYEHNLELRTAKTKPFDTSLYNSSYHNEDIDNIKEGIVYNHYKSVEGHYQVFVPQDKLAYSLTPEDHYLYNMIENYRTTNTSQFCDYMILFSSWSRCSCSNFCNFYYLETDNRKHKLYDGIMHNEYEPSYYVQNFSNNIEDFNEDELIYENFTIIDKPNMKDQFNEILNMTKKVKCSTRNIVIKFISVNNKYNSYLYSPTWWDITGVIGDCQKPMGMFCSYPDKLRMTIYTD